MGLGRGSGHPLGQRWQTAGVTDAPQAQDVPQTTDAAPAGSSSDAVAAAPPAPLRTVVAQGQRARKIAYLAAVAIIIVFTAVAFTLHGKTESGKSYFQSGDQIAMIMLGFMCGRRGAAVHPAAADRGREWGAGPQPAGWIDIPWDLVTAVRFDRGSPWVALDLQDDDVVSVMAVQAADKDYAVKAVRGLRALLAAHRARATG